MKRHVFLILSLICILLLSGCNVKNDTPPNNESNKTTNSSSENSEVKDFISYVNDGEYLKAAEYYNDNLYGNYTLEEEAVNEIVDLLNVLNDNILNGQKTETDSKKVIVVIDNVLSKTNLYIDDYESIKENIKSSVASKAAFLAGVELEKLNSYADAIDEYKNVLEADSNYNDAKTAIERCKTTMKQNVFDRVVSLVEEDKYIEAISQLKALNEILPDDEEVIAKISIYEKTYIRNTITASEEVFITPNEDYSKALDIINRALQHYSDNEDLNAKKNYYQAFAPVYLYDTNKLKGEADTFNSDKDIFGNNYEKCFWSGYSSAIWHKTDISYHLDKTYNTFTATVYSRSKKNDVQNMVVEIYSDGKIVYQNLKIADNSTQPFIISLDVTGVTELRIVLTRNNGAIGAGIGMTNMVVQKTVK